MQVHIRQAKVTDPASEFHNKLVDITVKNGVIDQITVSKNKGGETTVESGRKKLYTSPKGAGQLSVSPGWVDILADYREPGYEQKETIETGLNAAAAGGFTDVFVAPNTNPVIGSKSVIEYILKKATGHAVSLHPLGSISQNIEGKSLAEMMDMHAHGAIAFTDGWHPVQNSNLMLKALEYVKAFNGTLIQIPEDTSISGTGLMHEGTVSTHLGMPGIPDEAETIIINRDLQLLRYTGSRLHFTGVSTAAGVEMIRKAKREKLNVTCSVTPYHLLLTDEVLKGYDSLYKVSPPIRSEKDRKALIKGLKDGTIDCITSHHRPHEQDAKAKEFEYAKHGMNIQELAFNIALAGVADAVGADVLVNALSTVPRNIFGLEQATIAKGANARLTLFSIGKSSTKVAKTASMGINNPFLNTELPGSVVGIISNDTVQIK
ncbi:MAG: dihydroorotase [Chitinophagales bacterium]|nr:dihydroorotase [Chitinophagaceae bacterium]MCB9063917.1 dihydroorotase [Chitinophagales bacterium]